MRYLALTLLVLCVTCPLTASAQEDLVEAVSASYASAWPGLEAYRVKLKTDKIGQMVGRMTASLPEGTALPAVPELTKYWRRGRGQVIRPTISVMPTMEQMISRFSERYAVDLGSFLLPADRQQARAALMKQAKVKSADTVIGSERLHAVEMVFAHPTDLAGAFYSTAFDLPQRAVTRLVLDIDTQKRALRQMTVEAEGKPALTVDVRHSDLPGVALPAEVRITSPDGSIDERFVTTFIEKNGYYLPQRQDRQIRRPGQDESFSVEFFDYELETAPAGGKSS